MVDPIVAPKPPKTDAEIAQQHKASLPHREWWKQFRSFDELEGTGVVKMYIENVLPEGIALLCGPPKEGKSFLALSIAKALTTGQPLFGKTGYDVPEVVPVLYLAAESGDNQFKLRCAKFGITSDKTKFIARTLPQGLLASMTRWLKKSSETCIQL